MNDERLMTADHFIVHRSSFIVRAAKCSAGFTLIELLVVVTIVGLLMGMILVAVQHSRMAARRFACQSNLHQWALAVQNYATIHHGELPRRGQGVQPTTQFDRPDDWFNALPPLMESEPLTRRLADNVPPVPGESGPWMCPDLLDNGQPQYFAYGMNMWLSTSKGANPDRIDKVGPTTTMVFLADGNGTQCSVLPANAPYSPAPRHGGYVNLAFLDGHVTAFSGQEVGCGVGDPGRPDIRWVVPGSPWTGP
jgi:prepilin-type processing-associated H-X9-DG protein/prepilin-type N-terminal cleavage/methylation domain-containing protein